MKKNFIVFIIIIICTNLKAQADLGTYASLHEDQNKEKIEVEKMKKELQQIKPQTDKYTDELNNLTEQLNENNISEIHLFVRPNNINISKDLNINSLTYNNTLPGPLITISEGSKVKVILHNQLKESTSFYIQGLNNAINSLPTKISDLIQPNHTANFEFTATKPGIYFYRPQIINFNQMVNGLYGAILVLSKSVNFDKEFVLLFSEIKDKDNTYFLINGKQAPQIPPINVTLNQRIRLHLINAASESIPLALSGHKLEIIQQNCSDDLEPHVIRDEITLNPGDRIDCEFTADNPGTWSLSSLKFNQVSNSGKFPGGIACIIHYTKE